MPLEEIEKLDAKVKRLVKEFIRLQQENKKYVLDIKKIKDQKKSLEAKLEKHQSQVMLVTQLETSNKKLEEEKTFLQSKVKNILSNLDKLDFL